MPLHLQNPFVAIAYVDGENDFLQRHIRNSISLTVRQSRRMICPSHQHRAGRRWKEFLRTWLHSERAQRQSLRGERGRVSAGAMDR
jgi:hypothetical protein